jgi:hypothetical protein
MGNIVLPITFSKPFRVNPFPPPIAEDISARSGLGRRGLSAFCITLCCLLNLPQALAGPSESPAQSVTEDSNANTAGSDAPENISPSQDSPGWMQSLRDMALQFKDHVAAIGNAGEPELYVSGYAYHGRDTYTPERIAELNEKAWGLGYGKTIYNAKGDEESVYFLTIDDSHGRPQPMLGYAYQWTRQLNNSPLEVGAGYTAMLMSRADYYGRIPFPAVLPVASIGTRKYRVMASYVPRLSQNKGNGDVLLVFFRVAI